MTDTPLRKRITFLRKTRDRFGITFDQLAEHSNLHAVTVQRAIAAKDTTTSRAELNKYQKPEILQAIEKGMRRILLDYKTNLDDTLIALEAALKDKA